MYVGTTVLARGSLGLGWRSYGCAPRAAGAICCSYEARVQALAGGRKYHRRLAFNFAEQARDDCCVAYAP